MSVVPCVSTMPGAARIRGIDQHLSGQIARRLQRVLSSGPGGRQHNHLALRGRVGDRVDLFPPRPPYAAARARG